MTLIATLTPLGVVGYGLMLVFLYQAVHHWILFGRERQRLRAGARELERLEAKLLRPDWVRTIATQAHPLLATARWIAEDPARVAQLERGHLYMGLQIRRALAGAIERSERLKSTAPAWGLLFTVLGLIFAAAGFAQGESAAAMMGNLAPALGTTAIGMLIVIVEKVLLISRVVPLQHELTYQGLDWLLSVRPASPDAALIPKRRRVASVPPPARAPMATPKSPPSVPLVSPEPRHAV